MQGHKGDFVFETTGNTLLDFYSRAGSLFDNQVHYHGNAHTGIDLYRRAWDEHPYKAMQLAMWLRDCRGGAGNRSGFRKLLFYIGNHNPEWAKVNLHLIPQVGRWDDLTALVGTFCEQSAISYWAEAIQKGDALASKWAPREKSNKQLYHLLRKQLKLSPKEFRKLLAKNTKVVETLMCNRTWYEINYNHVPSVAMARSADAFSKHDEIRFSEWKRSLADPESGNKVHADVLFPHDCIKTLRAELGSHLKQGYYSWSRMARDSVEQYEESILANAQFAALPNYMEKTNARIMPICDFSGSMEDTISSNRSTLPIMRIDVSMALGLYCSDRVGQDNPFYRKFIPFSDNSRLVDWSKESFSVAVQKYNDGYCGTTNIEKALDQILDYALMFHATEEQMPTHLLIISDMQFDDNTSSEEITAVENCMRKWEEKGYKRPKIVFWNLAAYKNSPAEYHHKDVALVSGFNPSLLTAVLEGEDFTPMAIMERCIAKYEVVRPENIEFPSKSAIVFSDTRIDVVTCKKCKGRGFLGTPCSHEICNECGGYGDIQQ